VCGTFDEAMEFGQKHFQKRGLRLPPLIRNPWPETGRR
jgi:hypothetical protein